MTKSRRNIASELELRREFISLFESLPPEEKDLMEKILRGMVDGTITLKEAQRQAQEFIDTRDVA